MAARKNVIFIGMTQNGKSSLIQQILQYAGKVEEALSVGIGDGNVSETQKCSRYSVELPLKTHRLRQIEGPEEARNGEVMEPGIDFEIDEEDDFTFQEEIEDSGERVQLLLIDTPGLSDSGNDASSMSGMRVVDERHKLRILLTLQDVEDVHAICFVVRRDTHYGGNFQQLVGRMVLLLSFCTRSTTWKLQYHIIHTNITPTDRAEGLCADRQEAFDKFGPGGAVHHFLDNRPECDSPLETFFTNCALSNLFISLVTSTPVKFLGLQYPKSPEHECNDQILISTAQSAISELEDMVEKWSEIVASLRREVSRHDDAIQMTQKRIDDYDDKINELDQDTESEIDGQEGSTGFNIIGGAGRVFDFHSDIPIANVRNWNDGRGDWIGLDETQHTYRATLEPHWLNQAWGKITLYVTKRAKHSAEITELRTEREPFHERRETFHAKTVEAVEKIAIEDGKIIHAQTQIAALKRDMRTVQASGHSISLAQNKDLLKYFTMDSPLAAARGYKLHTNVPWTVPSLDKLPISGLQNQARAAIKETSEASDGSTSNTEKAEAALTYLSAPDGLPIGVFAWILRASGQSEEIPFNVFLSECKKIEELTEIDLIE